jgi:class 3 adenylate cyclase/TolB-like protein
MGIAGFDPGIGSQWIRCLVGRTISSLGASKVHISMADERTQRHLAAILAADVVGYSRLMERDEAATFERLRVHRKELFEPEIAKHNGRIFKLMGDGLLAEFGSVVDAVECAVVLQRGMAERNDGVAEDRRIDVRIGINLGDVIVEGEDRHGEGVNIAARLQQLAEPGGITVTRTVVEQVKHKLPLRFESLGDHQVKNIAEPVAVYRALTDSMAARSRVVLWLAKLRRRRSQSAVALALLLLVTVGTALWGFYPRQTPPVAGPRSLAVLPFVNMGGDPALDYFSDGITESITSGLARSPDLHVTARTSAAGYKGKEVDVRQIGRDLNVRYVLEGSVQKGANKLRIVAQLIDTRNGDHVWADSFDREGSDPLALQDDVTGKVIASLAGHEGAIQKDDYEEAWGKDTASLEEYDYLLRGHSYFLRWTQEDMAKARNIFQEGLAKFPDSPLMRVKIGWTYYQDWSNGWSAAPEEDLRRAHELAQDGLARPTAPPIAKWYGHYLLALTQLRYKRDVDSAVREAEVARALAPFDPIMLAELAEIFVWASKPPQAIDWLQEARRRSLVLCCNGQSNLAFAYNQAGQYENAIQEMQSCGDDCSPFYKNWNLMISYVRLGRLDEARAAAEEMRKARPDFTITQARAEEYYRNPADTERELAELRQMGFPEE